jgi:hypothetical protein
MSVEWSPNKDIRKYVADRRRERQQREILALGMCVAFLLLAIRVLAAVR